MAVEVVQSKDEAAAVGAGAYAHALPPSSRGSQIHRFLEASSIVTLLLSIAFGVWRVGMVASLSNITWILASIALGYVLADLGSGVVHWLGDRYGSPEMPVLGKAFIQPFRRHHVAPKEMTEHDFIETNGNNSIVTLPVVGAAFWLFPLETTVGLVAFCSVVSLAAWIFATNQIHSWSHQPDVGPVISWLQRRHIILEPRHHDVHHTAPFETYYCITSGVLNPILHKVRFWSRLEWLMQKVLGLPPYKDSLPIAKS